MRGRLTVFVLTLSDRTTRHLDRIDRSHHHCHPRLCWGDDILSEQSKSLLILSVNGVNNIEQTIMKRLQGY